MPDQNQYKSKYRTERVPCSVFLRIRSAVRPFQTRAASSKLERGIERDPPPQDTALSSKQALRVKFALSARRSTRAISP